MTNERIHSLELLRGAAAFAVALPHMLLFALPGNPLLESTAALGVEVFFVLSGYVLAPQLLQCLRNLNDVPIFLARRWLRTIPLYWLALICASLVYGELGSRDFWLYAFYVQNIFWQESSVDYYSIAWSLSVEEWFYVTFPLILIIFSPILPRDQRGVAIVAILFVLAAFAARVAFPAENWGSDIRRVVAFRLDSIAWGVLLQLSAARLRTTAAGTLTLLLIALSATALYAIAVGSHLAEQAFPFVASGFGIALILTALSREDALVRRPHLVWFATWAGRISYSTYLFHLIAAELILAHIDNVRFTLKLPICLLALISFCVICYWMFERPILRSRPNYAQRPTNKRHVDAPEGTTAF